MAFLCDSKKSFDGMISERLKTATNGLLPDAGEVMNAPTGKAYSCFCESTCDNLFTFSPDLLRLDREEFLRFQMLADELKVVANAEDAPVDELRSLCARVNEIYARLMKCCWDAFVDSRNEHSELGSFVVLQMIEVEKYEREYLALNSGAESGKPR